MSLKLWIVMGFMVYGVESNTNFTAETADSQETAIYGNRQTLVTDS